MKKLFLSVLTLSMILCATSAFAAMQTYERSYFETEELRSDWTAYEGTWSFMDVLAPVVPGHNAYIGSYDYETEYSASTFFNKKGDINTTNLTIGTSFGVPGNRTFAGIVFGAERDSDDYHSAGVHVADDSIYFYSNFLSSMVLIGSVDATDEAYYLHIAVSDENLFSWYTYRKNSGVWADDPFAYGVNITTLDPTAGAVGLFTSQGPNAFGSFTMTYDDSSPVPVPGTMLLLGMGVVGLAGLKRRQK